MSASMGTQSRPAQGVCPKYPLFCTFPINIWQDTSVDWVQWGQQGLSPCVVIVCVLLVLGDLCWGYPRKNKLFQTQNHLKTQSTAVASPPLLLSPPLAVPPAPLGSAGSEDTSASPPSFLCAPLGLHPLPPSDLGTPLSSPVPYLFAVTSCCPLSLGLGDVFLL